MVEGEYYVFATTMADSWVNEDPKRVAEHYKLRRGIENSKLYEQLRPWTTSNKMSVRFMLWFIPFVMCNLWVTARFITGRQTGIVGGRSPIPLHLFVSYMLAVLDENAKSGRPPGRPPPHIVGRHTIHAAVGPRSDYRVVRVARVRPRPAAFDGAAPDARRQHERSLPAPYGRHACQTVLRCQRRCA